MLRQRRAIDFLIASAVRGTITGVGTFVGGILHTLPFLIPHAGGFYEQVLGIHLARPIQGFAIVDLPYLPRFTAPYLGVALWPADGQDAGHAPAREPDPGEPERDRLTARRAVAGLMIAVSNV